MSGPAPKEDPIRRNKPLFEKVEVTAHDELRGPELPVDFEWHPRTIQWYETWRRSPQASVMVDTDWEAMIETAVMHTKFWRAAYDGRTSANAMTNLSAQLKSRMAQFGATYEDRLRLRMNIKTPAQEQTEEEAIASAAAEAVDYAQRLAKAASDLTKE